MEVIYHRKFLKLYEKAPHKIHKKFERCIEIFYTSPFDERLNNHPLHGSWAGYRSIDITGDWRAAYLPVGEHIAEFYAIGTHNQLYR